MATFHLHRHGDAAALAILGGPGTVYLDARAVRDVVRADSIVRSLPGGYYDNPEGDSWRDGDGLIWGVVARLPRGRYLAGWQQGRCDGGPTLSAQIFGGPGSDPEESAKAAAYHADGMAERAGNSWAEAGGRLLELRAEIRGWIAEARTASGLARDAVLEGLNRRLAERAELMAERETLACDYDHRDGWADGVAG